MRTFKTRVELEKIVVSLHNNPSARFSKPNLFPAFVFPYLILQPKMNSTNETKVILFDKKTIFSCYSSGKSSISLKIKTEKEQFDFAEEACHALGVATGGAFLNDGITRVDNVL